MKKKKDLIINLFYNYIIYLKKLHKMDIIYFMNNSFNLYIIFILHNMVNCTNNTIKRYIYK